MWGIVAIETTNRDNTRLCSDIDHPTGMLVRADKAKAIEEASSLSSWYQTEIRPDVVFAPVPLPLY